MVELHQLKARVLVLSTGFPAMNGCLVFLSLKGWLFYSVYSIFIWTTNWCANLSCIFYPVLENKTLEPWKNVIWWLSHDTSSSKNASLKKNARADYNKFLSEFHQERKWSYSAFAHSQPVPEVLSRDLLRLQSGWMCTWRCRDNPSWRGVELSATQCLGEGRKVSAGRRHGGILFLHFSAFIFTFVWSCLLLSCVYLKNESEFMEPFRRMSCNLWFMTSCRNCVLSSNALSVELHFQAVKQNKCWQILPM